MPARIEVELDIFSGNPNPTWVLSDAEADVFVKRLATLPKASATSLSGNLGYRGFIVQVTQGIEKRLIHVQTGAVQVSEGATTGYFRDEDRELERWLLDTGKPHLQSDLFTIVERELER